jgi:Fe-S-cluster-containing hydrogenase component 2
VLYLKIKADPTKCIGCRACEKMCMKVHASDAPCIFISKVDKKNKINICTQCGICAKVCPVGAITKIDKAFIIDQSVCVGCKICYYMCPFGVIEMVNNANRYINMVAQKCDLCKDRNFEPACVKVCKHGALTKVEK